MPQETAGDLNGPSIMLADRAADIRGQNLLPEADDASLMAANDWRKQQRSPSIARNYAGERLELCSSLAPEETKREMTMTKTKRCGLLAAALTAVSLTGASMVTADVPESPDPIRIAVNKWTGEVVYVTIAGEDCAQAFGTAEAFPNGHLAGYPADWGTGNSDVVVAIGLPFNVVPGGSEGTVLAEPNGAIAAKEPILMLFWQPHWVFAEEELNGVEWNLIDGECVEETQEMDTACAFARANVLKIQSRDFATKWPAPSAMMAKFTLTNAEHNAVILEVDQRGRPAEEGALEWDANNEAI